MPPTHRFPLSCKQSLYWNYLQHFPARNGSILGNRNASIRKWLKYYNNLCHAIHHKMIIFSMNGQLLTFLTKLMSDEPPNLIFWLSATENSARNELSKQCIHDLFQQSHTCLAKLTPFLKLCLFRFNRLQQMKWFMRLIAPPIFLKTKPFLYNALFYTIMWSASAVSQSAWTRDSVSVTHTILSPTPIQPSHHLPQ